jgi:hypothetical protein
VVEHDLAKVGVEGSSPFARSIDPHRLAPSAGSRGKLRTDSAERRTSLKPRAVPRIDFLCETAKRFRLTSDDDQVDDIKSRV